jgi:hypothetical protein
VEATLLLLLLLLLLLQLLLAPRDQVPAWAAFHCLHQPLETITQAFGGVR